MIINKKENVLILGAGPVGSLLAILFKKKGFEVSIYEKRNDVRKAAGYKGRSINIALSQRGWTALEKVGLKEEIMQVSLPMYGRMIHKEDGLTDFQPYSSVGDAIYSVARSDVNKLLIDAAEKHGVQFHFDQNCKRIDLKTNSLYFRNSINELTTINNPEVCIAADGAYSVLRTELVKHEAVNYSQAYLEHGYKEIHLPATAKGAWQLKKDALHIWPRKSFMLIALPNMDGSFTCTLFLQKKGQVAFEKLRSTADIQSFFELYFADIVGLIPDLATQFMENPTGSLVTIKCEPWSRTVGKSHYTLVGDAAHAITPFYGQGMNSGFEDATKLSDLIADQHRDWENIFTQFEQSRIGNTNAIADMAYQNFIEMRDGVTDANYLAKKKVEEEIKRKNPHWKNKYELVSFSDKAYSEIQHYYNKYDAVFNAFLAGEIDFDSLCEVIS